MRAIVARDDATAAADALLLVDGRIDLIVTVERLGRDDVLIGEANEILKMVDALLFHVVHKAILHVFDDPVTIFHDASRDLKGLRAKENELRRVNPRLDAADAADLDIRDGGSHLLEEAKSDRFDRFAAIARDGGFAIDDRHGS